MELRDIAALIGAITGPADLLIAVLHRFCRTQRRQLMITTSGAADLRHCGVGLLKTARDRPIRRAAPFAPSPVADRVPRVVGGARFSAPHGDAMRIYELRPVAGTEAHPEWQLSDYRGLCRVVAADEQAAREFAAKAFAKDAARGWSTTSAWHKPELVRAILVISGAFPMPDLGTVMIPTKGYPGFSPGRKARRRLRKEDGES
jgi:hypothetical protein